MWLHPIKCNGRKRPIVSLRIKLISSRRVCEKSHAAFVSHMLTPTIGGPYGFPYSVPSGGPRASIPLTQTCVSEPRIRVSSAWLNPSRHCNSRVEET